MADGERAVIIVAEATATARPHRQSQHRSPCRVCNSQILAPDSMGQPRVLLFERCVRPRPGSGTRGWECGGRQTRDMLTIRTPPVEAGLE